MDYKVIFTLVVLGWLPFFSSHASDIDSLGLETKDNRIYILHKVDAKETLYSLSRRYGSSVASIVENNQLDDNNLSVGAILRIPWSGAVTHRVRTGETLYSISRLYNISVSDIKKRNKLDGNDLEIDQELIIAGSKPVEQPERPVIPGTSVHIVGVQETLYSISKKYDVSVDELKELNHLNDNNVQIGDTLWLVMSASSKAKINEEVTKPTNSQTNEPVKFQQVSSSARGSNRPVNPQAGLESVTEQGIAAVIDESTDTKKYLALHPTAPVGTIMRVRNEMTNLSVFVRVVGKLPATGANNNVLIRLSKAAQTALGALDGRFRVELSYVPNQ